MRFYTLKENAAEAQRAALNKLRDDFNRFETVKPWWRREELVCFVNGEPSQYGVTVEQAGITQERAAEMLKTLHPVSEPRTCDPRLGWDCP